MMPEVNTVQELHGMIVIILFATLTTLNSYLLFDIPKVLNYTSAIGGFFCISASDLLSFSIERISLRTSCSSFVLCEVKDNRRVAAT